jgi:hypothetical protein
MTQPFDLQTAAAIGRASTTPAALRARTRKDRSDPFGTVGGKWRIPIHKKAT